MSRCCVVKVMTLTEIQLLQVGTNGFYSVPDIQGKILSKRDEFLCRVYDCGGNNQRFINSMPLEKLHTHREMQIL